MTNWRVATSRTGQSACSTPVAQSAAVRSSSASAASRAMRISATWCCTSGWCAIERVSAIEVRCGIFSTVMSKARRATPWYTAANPSSAQAKMPTWNRPGAGEPGGAHECHLRRRARRPRRAWCPGSVSPACRACPTCRRSDEAFGVMATKPWTICGSRRVVGVHRVEPAEGPHRGERTEDLVAVDLPAAVHPLARCSSTAAAEGRCRPRRAAPRTPRRAAASSSMNSQEWSPALRRSAATPVQYRCMLTPSAVGAA